MDRTGQNRFYQLRYYFLASCIVEAVCYTAGMKIPNEEFDKFIRIYKEEFGEEISRAQAEEVANDFLNLYVALASQKPTDTDRRTIEDESKTI